MKKAKKIIKNNTFTEFLLFTTPNGNWMKIQLVLFWNMPLFN